MDCTVSKTVVLADLIDIANSNHSVILISVRSLRNSCLETHPPCSDATGTCCVLESIGVIVTVIWSLEIQLVK